MPVYKQHIVLNLARGLEAFLKLEIGATRKPAPGMKVQQAAKAGTQHGVQEKQRKEIETLKRKLSEREREVEELRAELPVQGEGVGQIKPENMIWIFGTGRSGSTWLRSMMGELTNHRVWEEPKVGALFGSFYHNAESGALGSRSFIMGEPGREGWIRSIRNFTLNGARYARPDCGLEDYLVIKEPNGSEGAPLLSEALPESRMIFLLRDPRDVVASVLDGFREGSWLAERQQKRSQKMGNLPDTRPENFVRHRALMYMRHIQGAQEAYDAHHGPKVLVRYEDLVADTLGEMQRIHSSLGVRVDAEELAGAVEKHSWTNIPEDKKGEGKFYRKGASGGWREDLTPEQAQIVEEKTAPILEEFYSG